MNIAKLMKQAQEMQQKLARVQEELGGLKLEGTAGGGMVKATVNGKASTTLIALEHDLIPDFVTTSVLYATLASSVTLTIVLALI